MAQHNDFGTEAEAYAVRFLIQNNYEILATNYRYQKAEIDIIAKTENTIVIVEVKARSTDIFMDPAEAITKKKIKLLVMAANHFMEDFKQDCDVRFDAISIVLNQKKDMEILHLKEAFQSIDAI